jgi:hypothetical protein
MKSRREVVSSSNVPELSALPYRVSAAMTRDRVKGGLGCKPIGRTRRHYMQSPDVVNGNKNVMASLDLGYLLAPFTDSLLVRNLLFARRKIQFSVTL